MDEYIDILDEHGNKTGNTCLKSHAHRYGYTHASVHIWFYTNKHELLIQQRALNKDTFPGLWDVSVAGHISAGEIAEIAALREVAEEIGLKITPSQLQKLGVSKHIHKHSPTLIDSEYHHIYICELTTPIDNLQKQDDEVAALKLISLETFQKEIFNENQNLVYVPHGIGYYQNIINSVTNILNH